MKSVDPHSYDGFERKPESEWTEEERYENTLGFVPLTEAGKAAWREAQRKKNPAFDEVIRLGEELKAAKTAKEKIAVLARYAAKIREPGNEDRAGD